VGAESTLLNWLAVDAGATRIRVAAIEAGASCQRLGTVWQADFSPERNRVDLAVEGLRIVAERHRWKPPYQVALAWAGAPNPDGTGIVHARFGPAIPDLVDRLSAAVPLAHAPRLQSDARAALQGSLEAAGCRSAYGLTSGTGLGEAWASAGLCWSREEFLSHFSPASAWQWHGKDGESWLRADAWQEASAWPQALAALRALVEERLRHARQRPEVVLLGGHFATWFTRGWIAPRSGVDWWNVPLAQMPDHCALGGVVRLEQLRLNQVHPRDL
jgi:hypothetical protein